MFTFSKNTWEIDADITALMLSTIIVGEEIRSGAGTLFRTTLKAQKIDRPVNPSIRQSRYVLMDVPHILLRSMPRVRTLTLYRAARGDQAAAIPHTKHLHFSNDCLS